MNNPCLRLRPQLTPARRPAKRLRKKAAKAVTIGVGFLCLNGIVICADNQITWPGSHKYYKCKIYPHNTPDWGAVFTFAGNPNLMESFDGKFRDAMQIVTAPFTTRRIQEVIETLLSLMDTVDSDPDGLHMLCGIATPNTGMRLLKTERKVVSEVRGYDYVGVGDSSILRYLGQLITESYAGYTTQQAFALATYLVLKAKTHVEGCGGDTDAMILRPNGHIEPKNLGDTYNAEQQMLRIENEVRRTSTAFFDGRVSDQDFEVALDRLVRLLRDNHVQMRMAAGHGFN